MAHFEVHFSDGRVERFELRKSSMTIGRSVEADIQIYEPAISRVHARLQQTDRGRWVIADVGSRNKTYYKNKPIRSHVLTNDDTVYFGSIKAVFGDPSGKSDEKVDQTVYLTQEGEKQPGGRHCPVCTSSAAPDAVLCVNCGYNFQTGKRLQVQVDGTSHGSTLTPDASAVATVPARAGPPPQAPEKPAQAIKIDLDALCEWILPAVLLITFVIVLAVLGSIIGLALGVIGLVFRVIFMMIAMAIAAKLGDFGLGDFKIALLKTFGICAALSIMAMLSGIWFYVIYFAVLVGLLKLFFYLDPFEWFLIVIIMMILENVVLIMLLSALNTLMSRA